MGLDQWENSNENAHEFSYKRALTSSQKTSDKTREAWSMPHGGGGKQRGDFAVTTRRGFDGARDAYDTKENWSLTPSLQINCRVRHAHRL
jgi:hypothetical protein